MAKKKKRTGKRGLPPQVTGSAKIPRGNPMAHGKNC